MIVSFDDKEAEKIWNGQVSKKLPRQIQDRALVKLRLLEAAQRVEDLKIPPSNHLEILKGDRKGQYSIRINKQWRLCFTWHNGDAEDVEIVDYH